MIELPSLAERLRQPDPGADRIGSECHCPAQQDNGFAELMLLHGEFGEELIRVGTIGLTGEDLMADLFCRLQPTFFTLLRRTCERVLRGCECRSSLLRILGIFVSAQGNKHVGQFAMRRSTCGFEFDRSGCRLDRR